MSPHRDQEGVAIRHAVYQPVCTCGWRGISGCVVHPSLSERVVHGKPDTRSESDEQEPRT